MPFAIKKSTPTVRKDSLPVVTEGEDSPAKVDGNEKSTPTVRKNSLPIVTEGEDSPGEVYGNDESIGLESGWVGSVTTKPSQKETVLDGELDDSD